MGQGRILHAGRQNQVQIEKNKLDVALKVIRKISCKICVSLATDLAMKQLATLVSLYFP